LKKKRYANFPSGPFNSAVTLQNTFDFPFTRYGSPNLQYGAAVTKYDATSPLRAYNPALGYIGAFPRDPSYTPLKLSNGIEVTRYGFVIIQTNDFVGRNPGYQMRIINEDIYQNTWPKAERINHAQLFGGYGFWALVRNPDVQVYAAGNLFVDITNQKILGIDTRAAHYFRSFGDQDQVVNKAAVGFLADLGYPTSDVLENADVLGYFQEHPVAD
jgi:hypothetical protein